VKTTVNRALLPLALTLSTLALAVPASAGPGARSVNVVMTDYKFSPSTVRVARGAVTFNVVNRGKAVHDLKIAGRKTPLYASGRGGTLRVTFKKAGRYPFVCTVPGHVAAGMKGTLTVAG